MAGPGGSLSASGGVARAVPGCGPEAEGRPCSIAGRARRLAQLGHCGGCSWIAARRRAARAWPRVARSSGVRSAHGSDDASTVRSPQAVAAGVVVEVRSEVGVVGVLRSDVPMDVADHAILLSAGADLDGPVVQA